MPLGLTFLFLIGVMVACYLLLAYCCMKYAPEREQSHEFGHYVTFLQKGQPVSS